MPSLDEIERIKRLFAGDPSANLVSPEEAESAASRPYFGSSGNSRPSTDLYDTGKPVSLQQPNSQHNYQQALRNRFNQINQIGADATQRTAVQAQARAQQQAQAQQSGEGYSYSPVGNISNPRAAVLAAAASQKGTPYSWGGGGTKGKSYGIERGANTVGFDCSGLVQYAYAQIGMQLPRGGNAQLATGVRAPISALQPGDLVGTTGHIAIYAGNGMMWESPRTGGHVQYVPVRSNMFGVKLSY